MGVSDADELAPWSGRGTCRCCATSAVWPIHRKRVWRALTDDTDLAAWFPTTIEGVCQRARPDLFPAG